ncbi:hypothetical protein J6590_083364 [Homalodisca vitripennis]|nr:hypothetical protein J6590_083364 [Homalodisca vitripennis]
MDQSVKGYHASGLPGAIHQKHVTWGWGCLAVRGRIPRIKLVKHLITYFITTISVLLTYNARSSDNHPPRHAPCRLDTTAPAVLSTWLPRAPHLDDDPTALDTALHCPLNDPEVTLADPSPLLQTAGDGPRRHNIHVLKLIHSIHGSYTIMIQNYI